MLRIVFLLFFISLFSFSQEQKSTVVDFYDTYIDDELIYENNIDNLYTGLIQRKKANGQLIQEDYVEKGSIHYSELFYRKLNRETHSKYIYNKNNPYVLSQVLRYHPKGDIFEIIYYDYDGGKILEEGYEDGKLIHSCEFNGKKRHGKEFSVTKVSDTTFVFYNNGKKTKK